VSRRPLTAGAAIAVLLLGALGGARPALADASASGALRAKYLRNAEENASAFDARLELDVAIGDLSAGVVYRSYQLSDPQGYNPAGVEIPEAEIKHRYAEILRGELYARAGHFVSTFGRGLTLRSYEDVDLEYDTLLDGLTAEYTTPGATITALAGAAAETPFGEDHFDHTIRALRVSAPVSEWMTVAGSSVERTATEITNAPGQPERIEDGVLGAEVEAWLGPFTLAAEYAAREGVRGEHLDGHAFYTAGTLDLGRVTLFAEVKDYDNFHHYLVNPPTCVREHLWTLMNRATHEVELVGEHGFLAEGNLLVGEGLYLTGGASEARRPDNDLAHWEIFGQAEQTFGTAVVRLGGSWSREYEDAEYRTFTEHVIGAADIDLELGSGDIAEIGLEAERVEDVAGLTYEVYIGSVTFYPGDDFTFSTVFETSTKAAAEGTDVKDVWLMIEVKKLLPDDLEIGVSIGSEAGGKKCSGGVCYFEPEFAGARVRLTKFF
jgi:hypothetical protein